MIQWKPEKILKGLQAAGLRYSRIVIFSLRIFQILLLFLESGQLEQQLEEASTARRELDDASRQIKAFEKQVKTLKQEREDLNKVKAICQQLF